MNEISKYLLNSGAVHFQENPEDYFTWTSGKRSPIYCDNRKLISHPEFREKITTQFVELIKNKYSNVEIIAGTATAGIPWAAWISSKLNLPMVYIRGSAKSHGLKSAIEGSYRPSQKVLIIEDLISTGKSAIEALGHLREEKLNAIGILSIFTYNLKVASDNFQENNISIDSLCTLDDLLGYTKEFGLLDSNTIKNVKKFRDEL